MPLLLLRVEALPIIANGQGEASALFLEAQKDLVQ
jgi:hypothetical protein